MSPSRLTTWKSNSRSSVYSEKIQVRRSCYLRTCARREPSLCVTQDFNTAEEVERYGRLISEVSDLVVHKYEGSLKAEHGTGRNMAPFVEMEWGSDAYNLMTEIKKIFDPGNILNPGVILNFDPDIHLKNLKPLPASSEIIDKCTECGSVSLPVFQQE